MKWLKLIKNLLSQSYRRVQFLGEKGREEVEKTETGERQCLAEAKIWSDLQAVSEDISKSTPISLRAEDHGPISFNTNTQFTIWADLMDGTCGYVRNQRQISEPITTVITVTSCKPELIFNDIIASGLVDLRNGEHWVAAINQGAYHEVFGSGIKPKRFRTARQFNHHTPVFTTDMWRRVNGLTRLLWPYGHELLTSGSCAIAMMQVVLGEADLFFNGLPLISNQGQRGHELGAIYRLLKEAGDGLAMDMRTEDDLGKSKFTFDGQIPIILGVNRSQVKNFWNTVSANFQANEQLIRQLWQNIPEKKWSLHPLNWE